MGGTFDPVHVGHLAIAESAADALELDQVLFVPAGQPWMKADAELTAACHRMRMVELATGPNPRFACSDVEVRRPGPTYTTETIEELVRQEVGRPLYFIAGLDALREFDRWHRPGRLLGLAAIAGVARPGCEELDPAPFERVATGSASRVMTIPGPMVEVSGTDIRDRVRRGLSISGLVPGPVERYIQREGLYMEEPGA